MALPASGFGARPPRRLLLGSQSHLAHVALNYFLERDMREMGLRAQEESARRARAEA